jgi:capsular polysaccharide biosynthesis protein
MGVTMMENNTGISLIRVISRHWIPIAGIIAVSLITGILVAFLSPPVYEARSAVVVTRGVTQLTIQNRTNEITDSVVVSARLNPATVAGLARTEAFALRVSDRLKDQVGPTMASHGALLDMLKVRTSVSEGDLVTCVVSTPDPFSAILVANAWANNLVIFVNSLYGDTGLVPGRQEVVLKLASPAISADRISPNPGYVIGVAFVAGLVVSIFAAFLIEYILNIKRRTPD